MRLTEFWERMREQFGDAYAESVAKDYVLSGLGGRTVNKALADGEDAKVVWRAVCDTFNVPDRSAKTAKPDHLERSVASPRGHRSRPRLGPAASRSARLDRTNRRVLPTIEQSFHYSE